MVFGTSAISNIVVQQSTLLIIIVAGVVVLGMVLFLMHRKKGADTADERRSRQRGISAVERVRGDSRRIYDSALSTGEFRVAIEAARKSGDAVALARALARSGDYQGAVRAWTSIDEYEEAAELMKKCGHMAQAGSLYERAGVFHKAVDAFLASDSPDRAGHLLREMGDNKQADMVDAEAHLKRGEAGEAAKFFVKAGDIDRAAEVLVAAKEFSKAIDLLSEHDRHSKAAQLLEKAGMGESNARSAKAAKLYEQAQEWSDASRLYEMLGDKQGRIRCLIRGGDRYRAGRLLFEMGEVDRALIEFEAVTKLDGKYRNACLFRGQIYERTGKLQQAAAAYSMFLSGLTPSEENIHFFIRVGRVLEGAGRIKDALGTVGRIITAGLSTPRLLDWARQLQALVADNDEKPVSNSPEMMDRTLNINDVRPPALEAISGSTTHQRAIHELSGRYQFGEQVGQGGNGVVYRAIDRSLEREVVVKFLHKSLLPSSVAREYFLREARTAAKLSHPNIVTVFDVGEEENTLFFTMEWVEGMDLSDMVYEAGGTLTLAQVLPYAKELCAALEYAHDQQVIHRDIKPSNVMVNKDNRVKLLDFGLAKALDENPDRSVILCGTPYYMSPEQVRRDFLDHRTDIYSLGCLLYAILTGDVPFPDGDVFVHHQASPPPDPRLAVPELPQGISDVLMRCLAKNREDRYQRASEVAKAMSGLV